MFVYPTQLLSDSRRSGEKSIVHLEMPLEWIGALRNTFTADDHQSHINCQSAFGFTQIICLL